MASVLCPSTSAISRSDAPCAASIEAVVWRRSWKRKSLIPAASSAAYQCASKCHRAHRAAACRSRIENHGRRGKQVLAARRVLKFELP